MKKEPIPTAKEAFVSGGGAILVRKPLKAVKRNSTTSTNVVSSFFTYGHLHAALGLKVELSSPLVVARLLSPLRWLLDLSGHRP